MLSAAQFLKKDEKVIVSMLATNTNKSGQFDSNWRDTEQHPVCRCPTLKKAIIMTYLLLCCRLIPSSVLTLTTWIIVIVFVDGTCCLFPAGWDSPRWQCHPGLSVQTHCKIITLFWNNLVGSSTTKIKWMCQLCQPLKNERQSRGLFILCLDHQLYFPKSHMFSSWYHF